MALGTLRFDHIRELQIREFLQYFVKIKFLHNHRRQSWGVGSVTTIQILGWGVVGVAGCRRGLGKLL